MSAQSNNQEQGVKPADNADTGYSQEFLSWLRNSDEEEAVQARESIERSNNPSIRQEAKRQRQKL
jgi:hypothetical protein